MGRSAQQPLLLFLLWLLLAGCAGKEFSGRLPDVALELTGTPFFPQQQYQCGPAALAAVLNATGLQTSPDVLTPTLFLPGRQGSLQLEMIATIRRHHRLPLPIEPTFEAIATELQAGRPVLVLQNLGLQNLPRYHYAVVIGFHPPDSVILRSGITRRLVMPLNRFQSSWIKADSWGLVVIDPDLLPDDPDPSRYLNALADLESSGRADLAEKGYRTVLRHHPQHPIALFGLANSLYRQGRFSAAEGVYRSLLENRPDLPAVINNLAETLARMGRYGEALQLLNAYLTDNPTQSHFTLLLMATRDEIRAKTTP
jgi:hypothetical protein